MYTALCCRSKVKPGNYQFIVFSLSQWWLFSSNNSNSYLVVVPLYWTLYYIVMVFCVEHVEFFLCDFVLWREKRDLLRWPRQEMDCFFWAWPTIQMLQDLSGKKLSSPKKICALKLTEIVEFFKIINEGLGWIGFLFCLRLRLMKRNSLI